MRLRSPTSVPSRRGARPAVRKVIVIGASAGGAEALDEVLGQLSSNVPAAVFVVQHVAASAEVREALTRQSTSLAEEMVASMRTRAASLDDAAERTVRGWLRRPRPA